MVLRSPRLLRCPSTQGGCGEFKLSRLVTRENSSFSVLNANLSNVWEDCRDETTARRLARLDAGPSPGDPEDELMFRRHDILAISTVHYCGRAGGWDIASF
jgi:hypothetical protein